MSWANAKRDAKIRVAAILERVAAFAPQRPDLIPLTDYEDEASYKFLVGMEGWTLDYFRMVNSAVERDLRAQGFKTTRLMIRLDEYMAWLARYDLTNGPSSRAQFISWALAPEPKPDPR